MSSKGKFECCFSCIHCQALAAYYITLCYDLQCAPHRMFNVLET